MTPRRQPARATLRASMDEKHLAYENVVSLALFLQKLGCSASSSLKDAHVIENAH